MKPQHIADMVSVSDPALSPDGAWVAYVLTRTDLDANRYRSAIWVVRSDGTEGPHQLTTGTTSDGAPTWSPDSRRLVVTRESGDDDKKVRFSLAVLRLDAAGETVTLVERDEAIEAPTWSHDGRTVAFASRVRSGRYAAADDERARPPRRITTLNTRLDGVGWIVDRPTQLFVVPTDGSGRARRVTWDDVEYSAPTWAPDSRRLATTAARHDDADLTITNDIWVLDTSVRHDPADSRAPEPQRLTATDGWYDSVSWEPHGDRVAALRVVDGVGYHHSRVVVVDVSEAKVQSLTDSLDRNCAPFPGARAPVWRGDELLFSVEDHGRVPLLQVPSDGSGSAREIVDGARWTTGYDAAGDTVAFTSTGADSPSELFVLRGDVEAQLTRHQEDFAAVATASRPERFTVMSADGTELDAWALLPPGYAPDGRHPALLNIHGGPHTQYGDRWLDEFQLYASAGYVVLYSNPRGSTGYSEASARVLLSPASTEDPGEGWGPAAFDDLMRVVDEALERYPGVDASKLGVMGGSYGGYMTSWIVGHTDRFAAACSERAANNLPSLEWSSDAAGSFRFTTGVPLLDAPEEWARQSPLSYVRDITTPLLILHSDDDLRCPPEQADALWVALRLLKKDVDYYRFPAEGHELTRSGSPKHRIQRVELLLEWFGERLGLR